MTPLTLEVIKSEDIPDDNLKTRIFCVGNTTNPSWEEYYQGINDEYKPHFLLIKEWFLSHDKIPMASDFCNCTYFLFSDGIGFSLGWRSWGELAQAIVDKKEGYMNYY